MRRERGLSIARTWARRNLVPCIDTLVLANERMAREASIARPGVTFGIDNGSRPGRGAAPGLKLQRAVAQRMVAAASVEKLLSSPRSLKAVTEK